MGIIGALYEGGKRAKRHYDLNDIVDAITESSLHVKAERKGYRFTNDEKRKNNQIVAPVNKIEKINYFAQEDLKNSDFNFYITTYEWLRDSAGVDIFQKPYVKYIAREPSEIYKLLCKKSGKPLGMMGVYIINQRDRKTDVLDIIVLPEFAADGAHLVNYLSMIKSSHVTQGGVKSIIDVVDDVYQLDNKDPVNGLKLYVQKLQQQ